MRKILLWAGEGVYEPFIVGWVHGEYTVMWGRDRTGNPL